MQMAIYALALVSCVACAEEDVTALAQKCHEVELYKKNLEDNAPQPLRVFHGAWIVMERSNTDPEVVEWRTKIAKAKTEIVNYKQQIFIQELTLKKQQYIATNAPEPTRPTAQLSELRVQTITFTDGSVCDVVHYMRANEKVSGMGLDGTSRSFHSWNVKEVAVNENYRYQDRLGKSESIRTYRQLIQAKQKALDTLKEVQHRIAQQQTLLDGYQAAVLESATQTNLDGRAETQQNIVAMRKEEKPLLNALNAANADIQTFSDMQMYCALCEGSKPAARMAELNKDIADHQYTVQDADKEARMNAVIARERRRLTESDDLK